MIFSYRNAFLSILFLSSLQYVELVAMEIAVAENATLCSRCLKPTHKNDLAVVDCKNVCTTCLAIELLRTNPGLKDALSLEPTEETPLHVPTTEVVVQNRRCRRAAIWTVISIILGSAAIAGVVVWRIVTAIGPDES